MLCTSVPSLYADADVTDVSVVSIFLSNSLPETDEVYQPKMLDISYTDIPGGSHGTFNSLPHLHFNLSRALSLDSDDPHCVGWVDLQRRIYFVHQEAVFISQITLGLVTFSFTF